MDTEELIEEVSYSNLGPEVKAEVIEILKEIIQEVPR